MNSAPFALAVAAQLALSSLGSAGADAWKRAEIGGIRGVSIGPIENGYHPGKGYGSAAYASSLAEVRAIGGNWVALTPFGRVADLSGRGVDLTFEAPFERNRRDVAQAVDMAHQRGLRVMLVPHLWVESGQWRGELAPKDDEAWRRWVESYRHFLLTWAAVAEKTHADMLSVGVELRSWVTTPHAKSFAAIVRAVRAIYHGALTYSANWDDVDDTLILGDLDVIGINAFYPLADKPGAPFEKLLEGAEQIQKRVHLLAETWHKPVLFTETGYTTRPDPAFRPWEWPDTMSGVTVDEAAQATAYRAILTPMLEGLISPASSFGVSTPIPTIFPKKPRGGFPLGEKKQKSSCAMPSSPIGLAILGGVFPGPSEAAPPACFLEGSPIVRRASPLSERGARVAPARPPRALQSAMGCNRH